MKKENIENLEYEMKGLIKELKKDHPIKYYVDEKMCYINSMILQIEKELEK